MTDDTYAERSEQKMDDLTNKQLWALAGVHLFIIAAVGVWAGLAYWDGLSPWKIGGYIVGAAFLSVAVVLALRLLFDYTGWLGSGSSV